MGALALPFMMVKYTGIPTRHKNSERVSSVGIMFGISKASHAGTWGLINFLICLSYLFPMNRESYLNTTKKISFQALCPSTITLTVLVTHAAYLQITSISPCECTQEINEIN